MQRLGWNGIGTSASLIRNGVLIAAMAVHPCAGADPVEDLDTVRNSVAGMIEKLVEREIVTAQEAESIIAHARETALAQADARSPQPGDVRVTWVPDTVRDEIRAAVREDLRTEVANDVRTAARREGWGVPAALPHWIRRLTLTGDVRVRGQADLFDSGNAALVYRDFGAINDAGGIAAAGSDAFANTTEDRHAARVRMRLGVEAVLGDGWSTGLRLSSGNDRSPITRNATLGRDGRPSEVVLDRAWVRYALGENPWMLFTGGIQSNPFVVTDLVFDADLAFSGFTLSSRVPLWGDARDRSLFVTAGAYPLREIERSDSDPWLFAGQIGARWTFAAGTTLGVAVGYYDFDGIRGKRNETLSDLRDFTAPTFLARGNTLFDIRNDNNPDTSLFALASDYDLFTVTSMIEFDLGGEDGVIVAIDGEYVRNLGFDSQEVRTRTGRAVDGRDAGYQIGIRVGSPSLAHFGAWRLATMYRYLERDAILDSIADSDFHLGGTDAEGWGVTLDFGLSERSSMRLRYLTADEIDGPPLGIDVLQLDLSARL